MVVTKIRSWTHFEGQTNMFYGYINVGVTARVVNNNSVWSLNKHGYRGMSPSIFRLCIGFST